jgi:hypothetical protein
MPVPTIFLIDSKGEIVEMCDQPYDSEQLLQELLAKYPSVLAGDQMKGGAPVRWLLVEREAGIPDKADGAERWSLDHVFIDQNGIPTLVEVKRSSDTHIRREVIGQMLDYAANAVLYWPLDTIRQRFEETCRERELEPNTVVAEFVGSGATTDGEKAIAQFWEMVETNLRAGKIRLIFAADEIPAELRRVVEFLNEQMSPGEVLAIEIRQYVGTGVRTLVPNVIQSLKSVTTPVTRTVSQWDRDSFISTLLQRQGAERVAVAEQLLKWASTDGAIVWWGQGRVDGSCNVGFTDQGVAYPLFSIWTYGRIQLPFQTLHQRAALQLIEGLASGLNMIPGIQIPADAINRFPAFDMSILKETQALSQFEKAIGSFMKQIKTAPLPPDETPSDVGIVPQQNEFS